MPHVGPAFASRIRRLSTEEIDSLLVPWDRIGRAIDVGEIPRASKSVMASTTPAQEFYDEFTREMNPNLAHRP
jgi:hypothetical protein